MATPEVSIFQRFRFDSELESLQAQILTYQQQQWLHNLREESAISILNLTIDPQNPMASALQRAELQGKIGILSYLLEASHLTTQTLKEFNHGHPL